MEMKTIKDYLFGISIALVIIVFLISLIGVFMNEEYNINYDAKDKTTSFVYASPTTLTPTKQGITSLSATAYNNTFLSFDGVDDYVNDTMNYIFADDMSEQNFSFSLWINPKECGDDTGKVSGLIGGFQRNGINLNNNNQFVGGLRNSTSSDIIRTPVNSISLNTWNYLTISYDSNTKNYSMFIDGINKNSIIFTVTNVTDDKFIKSHRIGHYQNIFGGDGVSFNGLIDEVRIYNQTLTQSEITEIYDSGLIANSSLPSDGLISWWAFNEGTGTTLYDKMGGNDGTLTNFA